MSVPETKLFDGKFNRNLFNHEFEKYKKDQQKKNGSQLVKYENPNVDISFTNALNVILINVGIVVIA